MVRFDGETCNSIFRKNSLWVSFSRSLKQFSNHSKHKSRSKVMACGLATNVSQISCKWRDTNEKNLKYAFGFRYNFRIDEAHLVSVNAIKNCFTHLTSTPWQIEVTLFQEELHEVEVTSNVFLVSVTSIYDCVGFQRLHRDGTAATFRQFVSLLKWIA